MSNLDYIKQSYYKCMTEINPNQIVPIGPAINFDEPYDRDRFHLGEGWRLGVANAS
jgi:putative glutathione S-transferase